MSVAVQPRVQARHAPAAPPRPAHPSAPATLSKMPPARQSRAVAAKPASAATARPGSSTAASSPASSRSAGPASPINPISTAPSASSSSSSKSTPMPPPPGGRGVIAAPVPGKDLSSSTGRIFAKPSKEWVLPERAKPGRKAATDEPENRRQSQNRLSQRAHRARRTDYIQTLEERLRKYEADEIHSNVRLQEVARALKTDNERMRNELNTLNSQLSNARSDREKWNAERQKMADSIKSLQRQLERATLQSRNSVPLSQVDSRSPQYDPSPVLTPAITPRTSIATPRILTAATRNNTALTCPICPDPDPDCPCQTAMEPTLGPSRLEPTLGMSSFGLSRCGLCDLSPDACLCGPTTPVEEEDIKPDISSPAPVDDTTDCGLCTSESFCACRAAAAASSSTSFAASFSLNLQIPPSPPAPSPKTFKSAKSAAVSLSAAPTLPPTATVAAPAVALKLRRRPAAKQSVWSLDNVPAGTSRKEAECTGDPSNCDACRNDSFGREFCENLFGRPHKKCSGCGPNGCSSAVSISNLVHPETPVQQPLVLTCCGAPELCGHAAGCAGEVLIGGPARDDPQESWDSRDRDSRNSRNSRDETMRPEEAWRALKAHPNSKFTPLAILADVVARRSKVEGPRVELSPEPEGRCAETGATGAKRRLAVETSAVREALQYLDTHGADAPREAKRQRI